MMMNMSSTTLTPGDAIAMYAAAVLYLRKGVAGEVRFQHGLGSGTIESQGRFNWSGIPGEHFHVSLDRTNSQMSFLVPTCHEECDTIDNDDVQFSAAQVARRRDKKKATSVPKRAGMTVH